MTLRSVIPAFVLAVVVGGAAYGGASYLSSSAFAQGGPAPVGSSAPPVAASASPASASASPVTPATSNSPKVAEVAGQAVTKADVEQLYNAIKQRAGENTPPLDTVFWMLTDQIIASRLIIAQAKAQNLEETPDVQTALKMAHEQILQEAYVRKLFAGLDSDASLKTRYQAVADTYKGQEEVHARHILVEKEEEAKDLIAKLNGGADFAKLAQENSKDPGSKDQGGDLGFFPKDAMVPEFASAAFALEPGKVTPTPVKTQFGWHVIKLEERRARQAPAFDEVKPRLLADAQQEKLQKTIDTLRAGARVELFDAPGVPPVSSINKPAPHTIEQPPVKESANANVPSSAPAPASPAPPPSDAPMAPAPVPAQ